MQEHRHRSGLKSHTTSNNTRSSSLLHALTYEKNTRKRATVSCCSFFALTDSGQRKLQELRWATNVKITNTAVIRMEIFTGLWRVGNEDSHGLESYKRQEMKYKPDLNQSLHSPENATRTFSRNEQQRRRAAQNGTLLNHFWQHFGKNYLHVGTFTPLLTVLVKVFGAHRLYLEIIAYMIFDTSSISQPAGRWVHTPTL